MYTIRSDFKEKLDESIFLLTHLEQTSLQSNKIVETSIIKSAFMVQLYNIIESTVCITFEKVHENISQHNYQLLTDKIQDIYIEFHFKNQSSKRLKPTFDSALVNQARFPLLKDYLNKVNLFSGNIDAREINLILTKYGIRKISNRNQKLLVTIKNKRNKIAHGEEMFKESCRGFTINDLKEFQKSVEDSLKQLINNADEFLIRKNYLR